MLPFVNVSADPEGEFFSDGITFDIINHLAEITDLTVISRTSIMRYKGTDMPLPRIGGELGVATIVEGEVQRVGDRVRINAQLVDAATDDRLWAEQYDRELVDVFAIQSDVAQRVAALKARLTAGEKRRIERKPTGDLEAYNLYLKGRYFWEKRGEGIRKGLEYFGRALEIDEELAEAHASLGFVNLYYDWDWQAAEGCFERAIELNPGYAPAHTYYAGLFLIEGRGEEAVARSRLALELDPLSIFVNAHVGWMLLGARRCERARAQLKGTLELDSNFALAHWVLGWAYGCDSMFEECITCFEEAVELSGRLPWFVASLGWAYAAAGRATAAREVLAELTARRRTEHVRSLCLALVHIGLGELDEALDWLERAYDERDTWMTALRLDPLSDGLRSNPRFIALVKSVGM